jgi:phosphate transport system protein
MERHLDDELRELNEGLITMAALTETAIHHSIEALKNRDKALAEDVVKKDEEIDDWEIKNEEQTIELLALFQPMAKDLRFITTAMRINVDLERIADMAVNICQRTIELADQPVLKPLVEIPKLGENAKQMVKNSIDAFVRRDKELASQVILSDKVSNDLRNRIMHELVYDYMVKDGTTSPRAVSLLLIARDLERISDLASNIAEEVIYMIEAKVVKHHLDELIYVYRKVKEA